VSDETVPAWDAEQQRTARAAPARWAIDLLAAHPELFELIPPKRRFLYAPIEKRDDDD
jgi:hypothetical protein